MQTPTQAKGFIKSLEYNYNYYVNECIITGQTIDALPTTFEHLAYFNDKLKNYQDSVAYYSKEIDDFYGACDE